MRIPYIITSTFAAILLVGLPFVMRAVGPYDITGYGWSDTIGWVDFSCSNSASCSSNNFGMSIDASDVLSGYAWSENIGWISANASELAGCPVAPCTATISGGILTGWLRALSADGEGWDGWIRLSGSGYGPSLTNGVFSGYAWGSDVVGWVDFALVRSTHPGADVCPNITGNQATVPAGYRLADGICVNYCTPQSYCDGDDLYQNTIPANSCVASFVETCGHGCLSGACVIPPPPVASAFDGGDGHLMLRPSLVPQGGRSKAYWNIDNVVASTCSVVGTNGDSWTGLSTSGNGGKQTRVIDSQVIYTLECTGVDDSLYRESAILRVIPIFQER